MSLSQHIATVDGGLTRTLRGLLEVGLQEKGEGFWHPSGLPRVNSSFLLEQNPLRRFFYPRYTAHFSSAYWGGEAGYEGVLKRELHERITAHLPSLLSTTSASISKLEPPLPEFVVPDIDDPCRGLSKGGSNPSILILAPHWHRGMTPQRCTLPGALAIARHGSPCTQLLYMYHGGLDGDEDIYQGRESTEEVEVEISSEADYDNSAFVDLFSVSSGDGGGRQGKQRRRMMKKKLVPPSFGPFSKVQGFPSSVSPAWRIALASKIAKAGFDSVWLGAAGMSDVDVDIMSFPLAPVVGISLGHPSSTRSSSVGLWVSGREAEIFGPMSSPLRSIWSRGENFRGADPCESTQKYLLRSFLSTLDFSQCVTKSSSIIKPDCLLGQANCTKRAREIAPLIVVCSRELRELFNISGTEFPHFVQQTLANGDCLVCPSLRCERPLSPVPTRCNAPHFHPTSYPTISQHPCIQANNFLSSCCGGLRCTKKARCESWYGMYDNLSGFC